MQVERERGAIPEYSGVRVSNTWVIYLLVWNNPGKPGLIPHNPEGGKSQDAERGARGRLASWQGKSLPRLRSVAGLRGHTATLALKHGPDSYGRQQWGIFHNGGNPDAATPRERWSPSGRKALSAGKIMTVPAEAAAANYVPAAAVIRRQRALFGVTGRKGCVGGLLSLV